MVGLRISELAMHKKATYGFPTWLDSLPVSILVVRTFYELGVSVISAIENLKGVESIG